ncbi:MAG: hypothetical protein WBD95_15290, partial [Xanthobacteraceae bacterium]
ETYTIADIAASLDRISDNVANAAAGSKAVVAALGDVAGGVAKTRTSVQTVLAASEEVERGRTFPAHSRGLKCFRVPSRRAAKQHRAERRSTF